ncbi:hypothetical protein DAETH_25440 [Deinococcus aetherius]|uniref:Type I-E CRISPR-associated protein Cse2/CasB n=1 Tax=Deinococcus aetherius TaxID=200252 RepID=A0ABN6RGU5_9DEIO|nr:type I-E CRISPR-associated protein Cse2/CasB [Deinococcus aetherius]BDP42575.1 hypothetical protein DAETH_25440 [Deinococcus aetherius]
MTAEEEKKPQERQTQRQKQLEKWQRFFESLAEFDRGQLAKLRQSLANRPARFLTGTLYAAGLENETRVEWQRDVLELVAGLFSLVERPHDEQTEAEAERQKRKQQPLGLLLGELHVAQNRKSGRKLDAPSSIESRFLALLDADAEALPYQLRQALTLLKANDTKPDWARLTNDLMLWQTRLGDGIRREWSDAFYTEAAKQIRAEANTIDTPEPELAPEDPA